MNADPIEAYILKNERNFRIATKVNAAWLKARNELASDFIDRLDTHLRKRLKGWESVRYGQFFVDAYPGYGLFKPAWEDQYWVYLQCNDYGAQIVFGVMRDYDHIRRRPLCDELLKKITKIHPSTTKGRWWEANVTMRSPATDWREPEVLWRMHKDNKFLEEVAEQLLDVAKVSEPIIDRLARKK